MVLYIVYVDSIKLFFSDNAKIVTAFGVLSMLTLGTIRRHGRLSLATILTLLAWFLVYNGLRSPHSRGMTANNDGIWRGINAGDKAIILAKTKAENISWLSTELPEYD